VITAVADLTTAMVVLAALAVLELWSDVQTPPTSGGADRRYDHVIDVPARADADDRRFRYR
jgi:hypothetical protein